MNIDNNEWNIMDGYLISYRGTDLNPVIPEGVTSISRCAFNKKQPRLNSVTFPKSLEECGYIELECNKIIFYDTTEWRIGGFDGLKVGEIYIHNTQNNWVSSIKKAISISAKEKYFLRYESVEQVLYDKEIIILDEPIRSKDYMAFVNLFKFFQFKIHNQQKQEFLIIDNVLYNYYGKEENIVLPLWVDRIAPNAFLMNGSSKHIVVPEGIKFSDYCFRTKGWLSLSILGPGLTLRSNILNYDSETYQCYKRLKLNANTRFEDTGYLQIKVVELYLTGVNEREFKDFFNQFKNKDTFIDVKKIVFVDAPILSLKTMKYILDIINVFSTELIITNAKEEKRISFLYRDRKIETIKFYDEDLPLDALDKDIMDYVDTIYINNESGNAVSNWTKFFSQKCTDYQAKLLELYWINNLETIVFYNYKIPFLQKKMLNLAIGHKVYFDFLETNMGLPNEDDDEKEDALGNVDEEINELLDKIRILCTNLSPDGKNVVIEQVKYFINSYYKDTEQLKPNIISQSELTLKNASLLSPAILRITLLNNLRGLINKIEMNDEYAKLRENIYKYENYINDQNIKIPDKIESTEDKIMYIIIKSREYENTVFIKKINGIFSDIKNKISFALTQSLSDVLLKNEDNLEQVFILQIDRLYESVQFFVKVESLFKNPDESTIALIIQKVKSIITLFDTNHKQEYERKLNSLINNYYQKIMSKEISITEAVVGLCQEWEPFLEELKRVAPNYIAYKDVIDALNVEVSGLQKENKHIINEVTTELVDLLENCGLVGDIKSYIRKKIEDTLIIWRDRLDDPNYQLPEEKPILDDSPRMKCSSQAIEITIRILKELYDIKDMILNYLNEYQNYLDAKKIKISFNP